MNAQINSQFDQLKGHYECVEHIIHGIEHFFKVQYLKLPGWSPDSIPVVFSIKEDYPISIPYGFYVPKSLNLTGTPPSNMSCKNPPVFEGDWGFLSHTIDGDWNDFISSGFTLFSWVRSFSKRINSKE